MTYLKEIEEKQKLALELKALVNEINAKMVLAPKFLEIRFIQNEGFNHGLNAFLCVFISEKIIYP